MKKLIICLFFMVLITPVFAQDNSGKDTTDMYYYNVIVERVYASAEGYIVQYRKGVNQIGVIGIPNEWFTDAGGRGELMKLPPGRNWPTLSVFFKAGKFSHVRLYVHHKKSHTTWGSIPQGTDLTKYFKDADSFRLEFE
jgi:cytochrome c peroxidase